MKILKRLILGAVLGATVFLPAVGRAQAPSQALPPAPPAATSAGASNAVQRGPRLIVKFKAASGLRHAAASRVEARLSSAAGRPIGFVRDMSGDAQVFQLAEPADEATAEQIAAQLAQQPDVEYAEVDRILRRHYVPDDTEYVNQWHYLPTSSGEYGMNAEGAWNIYTGSNEIYVAVVDTGMLFNHPDLAGRTPNYPTFKGYDFVSVDPSDADFTRDGDGPDPDASDPGDYVTLAESTQPGGPYEDCDTSSVWHGTHVAGTIGALTDNAVGVSGVNWVSKIVPVRVLGKCGSGSVSDIVDGMLWAGGVHIDGVPDNPYPARVINLSLGGGGSCSSTWTNAINTLLARQVVVVSAGNSNLNASGFVPASCPGVITVAATRRIGTKASYSNFGNTVEISAPGGDFGAGNGVLSTYNAGPTTPTTYTYEYLQGTSMAAPHVAGVASLMLSLRSYLTPSQVTRIMQDTAADFATSGIGTLCTTFNCGEGIVDAGAALSYVNTLPVLSEKVRLPLVTSASANNATTATSGGRVYSPAVVSQPALPAQVQPAAAGEVGPCQFLTRTLYLPVSASVGGTLPPASAFADGGFEATPSPWRVSSLARFQGIYTGTYEMLVYPPTTPATTVSYGPRNGTGALWFRSCRGADEVARVSQRVALPANVSTLTFYWTSYSEEEPFQNTCDSPDIGRVEVNGAVLSFQSICGVFDPGDGSQIPQPWTQKSVPIPGNLAGQTVTLSFSFESDLQAASNWFVDDVVIQ